MKTTNTEKQFQLKNIQEIIELEERDRIAMNWSDRIASMITAFSGSMIYVWIHIVWFVVWICINERLLGIPSFDPFPFSLLTMIVSLEAIFLSSFVLISQNKQAAQADKRAKVDLQVNMIAEREITKLIQMVDEIQHHLHMHNHKNDEEIIELKQPTDINKLADEIDKAEAKLAGEPKIKPSAADTSV